MEFKIGDYVRVKDRTVLETGEVVSNWGGKIVEIYSEEGLCLIDLDAISLKSLDDKYLLAKLCQIGVGK